MRVDSLKSEPRPEIGVYSYGSKGAKGEISAQFEFDVTRFRDPSGQQQFKGAKGSDPDVRDWVCQDRRLPAILDMCMLLAEDLLKPRKHGDREEVISQWLSFAFKDYHGKWIAPAIAEAVANKLSDSNYRVLVIHHDLPKIRK